MKSLWWGPPMLMVGFRRDYVGPPPSPGGMARARFARVRQAMQYHRSPKRKGPRRCFFAHAAPLQSRDSGKSIGLWRRMNGCGGHRRGDPASSAIARGVGNAGPVELEKPGLALIDEAAELGEDG